MGDRENLGLLFYYTKKVCIFAKGGQPQLIDMATKYAILRSQHQIVETIDARDIWEVFCMAGNPTAEDLLKVLCLDGTTTYWCDSIEFTYDIPDY